MMKSSTSTDEKSMDKQTELIMNQLQNLIQNGKIIQAIKLVRMVKNVDLRTAKNFVDDFKRQIEQTGDERNDIQEQGLESTAYISEQSNVQSTQINHEKYTHDFGHSHQHSVEKDLPTIAYLHLQRGETIQAIKEIRDAKGLSLQQAKQMVDSFYSENPQYNLAKEQKKKSMIPIFLFLGFGLFVLSRMFD